MRNWHRRVTAEESAAILRLHHAEGWPVGTIGAELGRHHDTVEGVLYLNPGNAGQRRFGLPITLATIDVTPDNLRPEIHDLSDV